MEIYVCEGALVSVCVHVRVHVCVCECGDADLSLTKLSLTSRKTRLEEARFQRSALLLIFLLRVCFPPGAPASWWPGQGQMKTVALATVSKRRGGGGHHQQISEGPTADQRCLSEAGINWNVGLGAEALRVLLSPQTPTPPVTFAAIPEELSLSMFCPKFFCSSAPKTQLDPPRSSGR